ncbi:MAG: O-antigen translocase [Sphingomonadales bacterium]|nr:O-antigen translocase [Sphingomonadales bacterium]
MRLRQTLFANMVSLSIRLGANFALNKILAILIGPAGFALVGQLQNFIMLIQSATSGALTTGITKLTAQAEGNLGRQRQIWSTSLTAVLLLSLVVAIMIICLRGWIATSILGDPVFRTPLLWAAITLAAFGINYVIAAIFAGKSDVRPYASLNSAIALFNLFIVTAGAYFGHIEGALLASAISQSCALVVGVFLLYRRKFYDLNITRPLLDPALVGELAKYGLMALAAAASLSVGQIMVRSQIIDNFGLVTAGMYEALWRLSNINLLLFSTTLMVYALPKMTRIIDKSEFRAFYLKALAAATGFAALLFASEYLLRTPLFHLLFTSEFQPASDYFSYQAIGDLARVAALVTSTALIALSRAGLYIALEIIRFACFVMISGWLMQSHAEDAPALAYMLSFCVSALIGLAMMMFTGNEGLRGSVK